MTREFSRLLAILFTVLILAVSGVFGVLPSAEYLSGRADRLDQLFAENARYLALLNRGIEPAVAGERDPTGRIDLGTGAPGILGAQLEGYVRDLAARSGVSIRGSEVLPEIIDENVRRVRLRVSATAANQTLAQLIGGLNQTRPWIGIEELQVQAPTRTNSSVVPQLNLRITFYGLALVDEGSGT